jgi:hypothetical protein
MGRREREEREREREITCLANIFATKKLNKSSFKPTESTTY